MKKEEQSLRQDDFVKLVPGTFSKCYYCDVDNELCKKYNITLHGWNGIGEWTWENYCLKNGGCDR